MPLEGLRAWIGEVERKLGKRTRVFLALAVIAIGISGAAIYLAIDARNSSVSEDDVQKLQQQLEAQIGTRGTGGATEVTRLEAELNSLKAEVEALQGQGGKSERSGTSGSTGASAEDAAGETADAADAAASESQIQGLLEQAHGQSEAAAEEPAE